MTGVLCRTEIDARGVTYTVEQEGIERHRRRVEFGKRATHRAGGHAFRTAAQEQEEIAARLCEDGRGLTSSGGECPGCHRIMSVRERDDQGVCDGCAEGSDR